MLDHLRHQKALALAYFDIFRVSTAVAVVLMLRVLLMRRSVANKGTPVSAP